MERGRSLALAESLGVQKAAVSLWRLNGVPIDHMATIVEITGGAVTVDAMVAHAVACRVKNASARNPEPNAA